MVKNTNIFCVDCYKINTDSASCSECCYKGTSWLLLLLNEFIFKVHGVEVAEAPALFHVLSTAKDIGLEMQDCR
jgi:hypothetical protein